MGPVVAVIDSGIDDAYFRGHCGMFTGAFSCISDQEGKEFVSDHFPQDENGHGTMVVDLIHALNPRCRFLVVKILNADCLATTGALAEALRFLCTQQVDIIHMSISVTQEDDQAPEITRLCTELSQQGKVIVCSVENRKQESFPAYLPSVQGVTGGVFRNSRDCNFDPCRNIQFVCDATPTLVSGFKSRPSLFSGNSKAACVATSIIAGIKQETNSKEYDPVGNWLSLLRAEAPFLEITGGEVPCIQSNRDIDFAYYEWNAADVFGDVCDIFGCDKTEVLSERMIYACEDFSGERFECLFDRISQRLDIAIDPIGLRYVSMEWLWCLFEYIDQVYKQERNKR